MEIRQIIEALLFVSDKPLSLQQIKEVIEDAEISALKAAITELKHEYASTGRSFNIIEVAGGYQIVTDVKYADWLKKLFRKSRKEKLSPPSLETLAIVAYRQPITKLEIEDIRGVNIDGVLKTLLEKDLVQIRGRKQIIGRPFLYGTTKEFLQLFGLQSLQDLPKLEEFGELAKVGDGNVQIEAVTQEDRPD